MDALPLTGSALNKAEMEYYGKFVHTIERIQQIDLMSIIGIFYQTCCLSTQTVSPNIPGFQGINRCVQYLASHLHKPIFYPSNYYDISNVIRLTWIGNKFEDYTNHNCLEFHQDADYDIIISRKRSDSGILHTLIGIAVFWKVQIQPAIESESTDGEIKYMYIVVNKNKVIWGYMEALSLNTGAPKVH